jgi:hypothetical protein
VIGWQDGAVTPIGEIGGRHDPEPVSLPVQDLGGGRALMRIVEIRFQIGIGNSGHCDECQGGNRREDESEPRGDEQQSEQTRDADGKAASSDRAREHDSADQEEVVGERPHQKVRQSSGEAENPSPRSREPCQPNEHDQAAIRASFPGPATISGPTVSTPRAGASVSWPAPCTASRMWVRYSTADIR